MTMSRADVDALVAALAEQQYGHLPRRACTRDDPMPDALRDTYRWSHGDAVAVRPFFNLMLYQCPHCQLSFTAIPPSTGDNP